MRWDLDELALADGASHALVLVREPWGAQLVARMWALGISRPQAELLYHGVDACVLDERLDALERSGVRDSAAFAAIAPALRDSSRLVGSTLSPDSTERMLPELAYGARCERRIDEDRAGTTIYALTLDAHEHDNVYARDLHAADRWLLSRYPDRPVYLLAPTSAGPGARPRFSRVSIDSLERSWSSER
jgi:hypothetical protein